LTRAPEHNLACKQPHGKQLKGSALDADGGSNASPIHNRAGGAIPILLHERERGTAGLVAFHSLVSACWRGQPGADQAGEELGADGRNDAATEGTGQDAVISHRNQNRRSRWLCCFAKDWE
jgi:hypothetical protein